ncbi:MAG: DUF1841 family protein [Gammaproteobacteria bacterium]|jgi:hypothetical protein
MLDIDRDQSRQMFFTAWEKHCKQQVMEPVEAMFVEAILLHPEYHSLLENPEQSRDKDYFPEMGETNPFLHMSLHIAIKEQISINQPPGIKDHYQRLLEIHQDAHEVEHLIMECLAEMIWQVQRNQIPFDNNSYLTCIAKINK